MSGGLERLRVLLAEKLKIKSENIELYGHKLTVKWEMIARISPLGIFITAYESGKIKIVSGSMYTDQAIRDTLYLYKYKRRLEKASTEEEKKRVEEEEWEEMRRILEDFKQKKFEKYVKGTVASIAKNYMWIDEVARRISDKYGFELKFDVENEDTGFETTFDSTGMSDEQVINEVLKRAEAIREAEKMYEDDAMMNEFILSKGLKPPKKRRKK